LNKLKKTEDLNIYHVMQRVWSHAPDTAWIHSCSGFHYICNLCSEGQECLREDLFEEE